MPHLQDSAGSGCNSLFALALSSIPNIPESLIQCKVLGSVSTLSMLPALNSAAAGIGVQDSIGYMCMVISIWIRVMLLKLWFSLLFRAFLELVNSRPLW